MDDLNPFPNGPAKEAFGSLLSTIIPTLEVINAIRGFVEAYISWVEAIHLARLEPGQRKRLLENAAVMLTLAVNEFTILPN